jgi:cbb3-type cytochrome oxidase subunit 3
MDFINQGWVQIVLVLILIGLVVWWFKFRPQN